MRIFKDGYVTEYITTERLDTVGDEPAFSVVTRVEYNAPISKTALKVWNKHRCTFQYDDFIRRIAVWRSNTVQMTLKPVHWGLPIKGSDTWGRLRISFICYGLVDEVEIKRIKALGTQIRKGLTLLARDLE